MGGNFVEKSSETDVGDEKWPFSWDENSRLVQVSKGIYAAGEVLENEFTVDYHYDERGRTLRRPSGAEVLTFVWDGWDLLSETTDSVTTTHLVPDGLLWSFVHGEEVLARFEYGAYGELLPGPFDGVGTDLETGLYSMRHRWYDPELQRFISRDPIGLRGGANLFTYVENNPVNWVDPDGLDLEVWMVPQGNPPTGNGHVWLEVSENGKSLFSLGAYAGTGKNLKSPDPHCGGAGARKVVSFPTDHEKNLQMISEFKNLIKNQKPGEWYANPRDPNPDRYFKEVDLFGVVKYRTLNPDTMRVCTTVARELVDKTIKPGPDKRLPPLFQPNNLWNHYHPKNRLPAGQFNFKGHPAPP